VKRWWSAGPRLGGTRRFGAAQRLGTTLCLAGALLAPRPTAAAELDASGSLVPRHGAVVFEGFESDFDAEARRYLPTDAPAECLGVAFERREQPDAIEGAGVLHVNVQGFCSERILLDVPRVQGSYRASVWMRHGSIDAQLTAVYPPESGLELLTVKLAPSGRTTSDGWVELESNAFPIDGAAAQAVYLRVTDVDDQGSEIDGIELLPDGAYWSSNSCSGLGDSACGDGEICVHQRCRLGRCVRRWST
jgi:hypothetical protein